MTDGQPDDKEEVLEIATLLGRAEFPMACVGVSSCDKMLMHDLARRTGGMFLYGSGIAYLSIFFLRQVMLVVYVLQMLQMAKEIKDLLNREMLRQFFEKDGSRITDEELGAFLVH